MANSLNTLNLNQIKGGVNIKQADISSELSYQLCDSYGDKISFLNGKEARICLYSKEKNLVWNNKAVVDEDIVSFKINEPLAIGTYKIEIKVDGHIFPSDQGTYIRITQGYDLYVNKNDAGVIAQNAEEFANKAVKEAIKKNIHDIKGPRGDTGPPGIQGEPGPPGEKGKDCEVVDDLESDEADKALSARQGKILKEKYDELFYDVDNGKELIAKSIIDKNIQASKTQSFEVLANKIREVKTGWDPGHKFRSYDLKFDYDNYVDDDISIVLDNIQDALLISGTNDACLITRDKELVLTFGFSEMLVSNKYKYLSLWEINEDMCAGLVSVDNDGVISIHAILINLEDQWIIDTQIPSNKDVELEIDRNILCIYCKDKSLLEIHNRKNNKVYIIENFNSIKIKNGIIAISKQNELTLVNSDGNIDRYNLDDYMLDKLIDFYNGGFTIHTKDYKIYEFKVVNGQIKNSKLKIDLSSWAKGKLLSHSSCHLGYRYTYEGRSLLVKGDLISIAYEWDYDISKQVNTLLDNIIIFYIENNFMYSEIIDLYRKEKSYEKYPYYSRILKTESDRSVETYSETIYFVLNGYIYSWSKSGTLEYILLPELPKE